MRRVLNLLLTFAVFFGGWKLFPEIFQFSGLESVIVTTLLKYVVGFIFAGILIVTLLAVVATEGRSWKLVVICIGLIVCCLFFNMLAVSLISRFYDGFYFAGGFWQLFVTGFVLTIFTIDSKNNNDNSNDNRPTYRYGI